MCVYTTQGGRARVRARVSGRASCRPDHLSPTPHTASSACCSSAGGTPHRRSALISFRSEHNLHTTVLVAHSSPVSPQLLPSHPLPHPPFPIPPSPRHSLALSHATTLSCCGGNRASSYKLQRGQGAYARRNIAHATRAHPLPAKCHKGQLVLSLYHPFDTSRSSRRNEACGGGGRGCGHG